MAITQQLLLMQQLLLLGGPQRKTLASAASLPKPTNSTRAAVSLNRDISEGKVEITVSL
jgi:hypothetical protein